MPKNHAVRTTVEVAVWLLCS